MSPLTAPLLRLNNGVTMPALGLGVFQSPPRADRREHRRLRLRARRRLIAIDGLDTGRRGGPEPDDVTLEAFGREIPDA